MDRNAPDVAAAQLYFAGMQTGAHWQSNLVRGTAERERAPDRAARAIKGGEHTIARRLHQHAAVTLDCLTRDRVVLIQAAPPTLIAQLGGLPSRVNDVGEHYSREDPL